MAAWAEALEEQKGAEKGADPEQGGPLSGAERGVRDA